MAIWIVSLIIVVFVVLLITERIPLELTAIGMRAALMLSGVLNPIDAVKGFASPAVITVGAMFIISRALVRTGVVGVISEKVIHHSHGNAKLAKLLILVTVAGSSAFINNTPVVVLFIPIVLSVSCEYNFSPSNYLIPISYTSILAGTCTLIGTSTNIIVSDLSFMHGYGDLGMFELSPLGVPIAVLGVAFLYLFSSRVMPGHAAPTCELQGGEGKKYLAELLVPEESQFVHEQANRLFGEKYPTVELFEVIRGFRIFYPHRDKVEILPGDLLFVKSSVNDLMAMLSERMVKLPYSTEDDEFPYGDRESLVVELIVQPQSTLLGERLLNIDIHRDPGVSIIAVKRQNVHYTEQRIRNLRLRTGDIVLVRCPSQKLDQIRAKNDFIIVEDVHYTIIHKQKARWSILIFCGVVGAASVGLADIMVCAMTGVFLMILAGCIQLREAYSSIQGSILILIAGTIAIGTAMEKTGAAKLYAETFLALFQNLGPHFVLAGIMLLTSMGTHVMSNNAAAIVVLPVAIAAAVSLGVNPKPFIVGVCFGASACYATPIGYQTNLMVYGPGRYRFSDYLKLGIPLNLLVLALGSLFIPILWPF